MDQNYDVIVIGSGLGGLTAASILTQVHNKRVLLLEKHYIIGGQTNEFHRGKFSWEVVMSNVGGIGPDEAGRRIIDLVTNKKVNWNPLPRIFQKLVFPDRTIEVPSDEHEYQQLLMQIFPDQTEPIQAYFQDIVMAKEAYLKYFNQSLTDLNQDLSKFLTMTTQDYLDRTFQSEPLKRILSATWGDYGTPPEKCSFAMHALSTFLNFKGGYFPEGGSQKISQSVVEIIKSKGGQVLIGTEVTRIIVQDNRAVGVKTRSAIGKEIDYYADQIISGAGSEVTYSQLLASSGDNLFIDEIAKIPHGLSVVILYLGLNQSPVDFGIQGEDIWLFDSYGPYHPAVVTHDLFNGVVHGLRLTFPTLRHHTQRPHTVVASVLVDPTPFLGWYDRPPEYQTAKDVMTKGILDFIEKYFSGFGKAVGYKELGTPLTVEHFINKPRGELYGFPVTPSRFSSPVVRPKTRIKNLYLSGNDVGAPGYFGAMLGGLAAVAGVMGEPNLDWLDEATNQL